MVNPVALLGADITVGEHVARKVGPFTFNLDTIWPTLLAAALVALMAWVLHRKRRRQRAASDATAKSQARIGKATAPARLR